MAVPVEIEGYSVTYFDCIAVPLRARLICASQIIRYSCIYKACMGPVFNRSSAIWCSNAIDRITFDFYMGLPPRKCHILRISPPALCTKAEVAKGGGWPGVLFVGHYSSYCTMSVTLHPLQREAAISSPSTAPRALLCVSDQSTTIPLRLTPALNAECLL